MNVPDHGHIPVAISGAPDVLAVRCLARALCTGSRLSATQYEHVSLIVTELATNLLRYAEAGGTMLLRRLAGGSGIECLCYDRGPGIADIPAALRNGSGNGGSQGVGLGAVQRLSNVFDIHSRPGLGTAILSRVYHDAVMTTARPPGHGAVMLTMAGMRHCGDGWIVTPDGLAVLIDGLGHGLEASLAARRAEASVAAGHGDPLQVLLALDVALRDTRGAVVMVAKVERDSVTFAGVGNIAGAIIGGGRVRHLHSSWGVVGSRLGRPALSQLPWAPGDVLLLHSDGMSQATEAYRAAHLLYTDPTLACTIVLRDAVAGLDDRTILLVRQDGC